MSTAASTATTSGYAWLPFAFMTVACWGLYGVLLHKGGLAFDAPHARYKAFLFVGVAYFVIAIVAPLVLLILSGTSWQFLTNTRGVTWSLMAGIVGAVGAFGVLLAFGAGGKFAVVPTMSIIFAGAPIINAIVANILHPPPGGWGAMRWQFVAGSVLAAGGGCLVTVFKPA